MADSESLADLLVSVHGHTIRYLTDTITPSYSNTPAHNP